MTLKRLNDENDFDEYFTVERRYKVRGIWKPWALIGVSPTEKFDSADAAHKRILKAVAVETAKEAAQYRINRHDVLTVQAYEFVP